MIEFLNKLFGRQPSGATAKERLRLVLMSDHLSLAPDMIDAMKRDLVDVISRYVEVDREKIDVHFEHQDKALAMLANIPITGVNRNGGSGTTEEKQALQPDAPASPADAPALARHSQTPSSSRHGESGEPQAPAQPARRRKRRKHAQGGNSPQTGSPAPAT